VVIIAHKNSNGYFPKREKVQHRVLQVSVLGLLLFLIYVNDLSTSVSDKSSPILFADDTSDETEISLILMRYLMN